MFDPQIEKQIYHRLPHAPLIVVENQLYLDIDDLVGSVWPKARLAVVFDKNTGEALGERVLEALNLPFDAVEIRLEGTPVADEATVNLVKTKASRCDGLVAVGSGTINDLCKFAATESGKPYLVFPTAASMNGYLSANASITVYGHKKTMPASMPLAVFCDMSVIASAPARLSKSGLGDSLARPTAQADWLLSSLLLGTAYDQDPFTILHAYEPALFDHARGVALADMATITLLMKVLLLSGLGMTLANGSYPASQAEHMIAHGMGMLPDAPHLNLHGEEIGVTTLTMARMQEQLLHGKPGFRHEAFDEAKIAALFGQKTAEDAKPAFAAKQSLIEHAHSKDWQQVAGEISNIMLPAAKLQSILEAAEAPVTPEALGWNMNDYATVVAHARFLRDRFTFLDLA